MSEARIDSISNEHNTGGPTIAGITTFSGANYFVPPVGGTAERPENPEPGSIRFNTDSKHLEYYRGNDIGWVEIEASNEEVGGEGGSNEGVGVRGVFGCGYKAPGNTDVIEYLTISTLGDAKDFGDATRTDRHAYSGVSSRTRGCWGGGFPQSTQTTIDYITFAQLGNATDFGDMFQGRIGAPGLSNETRGCWMGGYTYGSGSGTKDTIDYITIATTGNAQDFGNLGAAKEFASQSSCASSTRGIAFRMNGNAIEYITIATTGNATDFGDDGTATGAGGGLSNATRGIIAAGGTPGNANTISYITIATTGNSSDFGDLNQGNEGASGVSSPTRGVIGGMKTPSTFNTLEYIEIPTTGNSIDFGDLTEAKSHMGACSNGHGGL